MAETYYSYWEQYTYWVGQGWTVDVSGPSGDAASGRSSEINPEQGGDGAEGQEKAPHGDVEGLNRLFGETCTLELGESREVRCSDARDGGNTCERPASSSQHNAPQQSGNECLLSLFYSVQNLQTPRGEVC